MGYLYSHKKLGRKYILSQWGGGGREEKKFWIERTNFWKLNVFFSEEKLRFQNESLWNIDLDLWFELAELMV